MENQEIKDRIFQVFGKEPSSCTLVRQFVLEVEFSDTTDLSQPLDYDHERNYDATVTDPVIKSLIDDYSVIIFRNAQVKDPYKASMKVTGASQRHDPKPFMNQDMFHRDFTTSDSSAPLFATFLMDPKKLGREAPTYYALRSSVIKAAQLLDKADDFSLERNDMPVPEEVTDYFKRLTEGKVKFAFENDKDNDQRLMIFNKEANNSTTERIFNEIPDEEKYAVTWNKGQNIVVLHSNINPDVLHARPGSKDRYQNIKSLDLMLDEANPT